MESSVSFESTFGNTHIRELSVSESDDRTITGATSTTISSSESANTTIYGAMTCAGAIGVGATSVAATYTQTARTGAACDGATRAQGGGGGGAGAALCRIAIY